MSSRSLTVECIYCGAEIECADKASAPLACYECDMEMNYGNGPADDNEDGYACVGCGAALTGDYIVCERCEGIADRAECPDCGAASRLSCRCG